MPGILRFLLRGCLGLFIVDDLASEVLLLMLLFRRTELWYHLLLLGAHQVRIVLIFGAVLRAGVLQEYLWDYTGPLQVALTAALPATAVVLTGLFWERLMTAQFDKLLTKSSISFLASMHYTALLMYASQFSADSMQMTAWTCTSVTHGLNCARLGQLTRRTFAAKEEDPEVCDRQNCCICLSEFNTEEKLIQLNCGHIYHEPCIAAWLLRGGENCPLRCAPELVSSVVVAEDEHTVHFVL